MIRTVLLDFDVPKIMPTLASSCGAISAVPCATDSRVKVSTTYSTIALDTGYEVGIIALLTSDCGGVSPW